MLKNVLIGIGGTGSRVIESVIHLCAAGLGPDKLHVFMIDPDEANGNLTRTKSLITKYSDMRRVFKAAHLKDASNPCFRTEIVIPPNGEPLTWNVMPKGDTKLSAYITYESLRNNNENLALLADILFTKKELETPLDLGFRGHPSIGAVVMADPDMDKYPFKLLWDTDISSFSANQLRVFLVGSIFGGTGAAGFPTLGSKNMIKFNDQARLADGKSKVLLGGALVLPYFSFALDPNTDQPMFVTPSDFPVATKAALQYYDNKELGVDQYYFIGDSMAQKVGEFSAGAAKQDNIPHYVEAVSALASFDFFAQPESDKIAEKKYYIASRDSEELDWDMIPVTRNGDNPQKASKELKDKLGDFTIFAYSYLTYGKAILDKSHKDLKDYWYKENFKDFNESSNLLNPRHEDNNAIYKIAEDYLNDFLYWICALDTGDKIKLIDSAKMLSSPLDDKKKVALIYPEKGAEANIGEIIKGRSNKKDFNSFQVEGLGESAINERTMAAGNRYLNIFYHAAVKFNKLNQAIN